MTETLSSPIQFSESFQLNDKSGVAHTYTLSGTLAQKPEIQKISAQSIKAALAGGWTVPSSVPAQPAMPQTHDPNSTTEIIMAEKLIIAIDETGKHFSIKGGKYKKFGVAIYPEYLEALGIPEDMPPGGHEFKKKVVVQTTRNGDKSSSKVIALA
jgi:hypothetical protein